MDSDRGISNTTNAVNYIFVREIVSISLTARIFNWGKGFDLIKRM